MSDKVSNYIKLTIPSHLLGDGEVQARVDEVTRIAGGVSLTPSKGEWFDDKGVRHVDDNVVVQWNFKDNARHDVLMANARVVHAMFTHGEKAVFRERYYRTNLEQYRAVILYTPVMTAE